MAELGAISQYALSVQQMQLSVVKMQQAAQQQIVNLLTESTERMVATSSTQGNNIDISI